jgi:putative tricarboxylic transport membrane protein
VIWSVAGFLVFALTIEVLGWILAAALLFWAVARGIGSRRPLFDISLALVLSSAIYLAFSVGLGLNLPSGILGGGF